MHGITWACVLNIMFKNINYICLSTHKEAKEIKRSRYRSIDRSIERERERERENALFIVHIVSDCGLDRLKAKIEVISVMLKMDLALKD